MESIDFSFDLDYQQKYDSELVSKEFNSENNTILVENQVINYANDMNREPVVNDVFLNQNNRLFDTILDNYENIINDIKFSEEERDSSKDPKSGFQEVLDHICDDESLDSLANQSMFGCICCHSCQYKSNQFMTKTNQLIQHFKSELKDFKESVRKHLCDFNSQINGARLDFTQVIVDLQIKLNQKNNQLEKILNLSQFLSNNYQLLLSKSKDESLRFENVCKENIKYRKQLGIELKVVLNSEECKKAIKEFETINDRSVRSVETVDKSHIKSDSEDSVSLMSETSPQSLKQLSPLNSSQNSDDLELRIKDLLEKYEKSDTIPLNDRKRRREAVTTSPRKYQMCQQINDSKHCETPQQHKNHSLIYINKYPENLLPNNIQKSSTASDAITSITPITTYSKSGTTHKPLILSKSSHQSINSPNNNIVLNGKHQKSKSCTNKVYENLFQNSKGNQINKLSDMYSNQNNSLNGIKIEPNSAQKCDNDLVNKNELKIKIKIPKDMKISRQKGNCGENKRYCKRCDKSLPNLSSREFKDHIYNVCPARDLVTKTLLKCDLCPREFLNSSALTSHRRAKHNAKDKNITQDKLNTDTVGN